LSTISWTESDQSHTAAWHSENATPPPDAVVVADDWTKADTAFRLASQGTALLWRGDFHNARQLLRAIDRRIGAPRGKSPDAAATFHRHREHRGRRALVMGRLLVVLGDDYRLDLRRAPDVRQACIEAYGPPSGPMIVALTELLGVTSAHQWREKGVAVPALGDRVHPHYGVFSPVRGEYIDLVAEAPLPDLSEPSTAFDLGTGTGVLAAVLARRGIDRVVATDINPRALACARDNAERLGLAERIEVTGPRLYPKGRADLVVCNPPWLPGRPTSAVEGGVYDPDGSMLHDFLAGLTDHVRPGGEGWLVLSDLAEHLGLRSRGELLDAIEQAGLRVVDRIGTRPSHPGPTRAPDLLAAARRDEVTSLWRLRPVA
jgi:SAM-dependent methyltransferase